MEPMPGDNIQLETSTPERNPIKVNNNYHAAVEAFRNNLVISQFNPGGDYDAAEEAEEQLNGAANGNTGAGTNAHDAAAGGLDDLLNGIFGPCDYQNPVEIRSSLFSNNQHY